MYDEELNKYIVPEDAKPAGTKRGRKKSTPNANNRYVNSFLILDIY